MTDTLTKGKLFKDDCSLFAGGATTTGTRKTSTGGSQTLEQIDWVGVDVYGVYGARTGAAITSALNAIGSTNKRRIWLSPGDWTLSANLTIPTNVHLCMADGAQIDGAFTLTINGKFTAGDDPFGAALTVSWGAASTGIYIASGEWIQVGSGATMDATAEEIDRVCDGNTATAAELSELHSQGVVAADFAKLHAVTSTAAELSELHSQGAVADDFAKLHAITASSAEINASSVGIGVTISRQKIVEIGDWNMDSTSSVQVAHGLTQSKIRGIRALIRSDDDATVRDFNALSAGVSGAWTQYIAATATKISLSRAEGSHFDNTSYDSTSFNRGWMIIDYVD